MSETKETEFNCVAKCDCSNCMWCDYSAFESSLRCKLLKIEVIPTFFCSEAKERS